MPFYAKVDNVTGKIFGSGVLERENVARMPCLDNQMMIEVRETVDTSKHFFVDLETHDLLDINRQKIASPTADSGATVASIIQSPVKHLPSENQS